MAGQQLDIYVAAGITWAAAFIALILRMVARRITKLSWWYDDYICLAAFAAASAYNIIMLYWASNYYLGQVLPSDFTEEQREEVNVKSRLLMLCCEYCYATSIACTKFTILVFYWRLFKSSSIRLAIQIMFGVSVAWILLRTFMVSFQCIPLQYFWDKDIKGHCSINEAQFFFGTILTHCIMDIIIFVLPILEVSKLRLRLGQKLGVIGLFLIGFIVCLASIFTIVESIKYPSKTDEMPRDTAPSFIWGNVEMNIAIVSACVPLLRPVFRTILPHSFLSSYGSSHPISGHPISRTNASRTHPSNAIKLSTLTKNKEVDAFETSSTHKLADPEEGLRTHSDLDQRPDAFRTVITSNSSRSFSSDEDNNVGIYMRNDITVQVEDAQKSYTMRR